MEEFLLIMKTIFDNVINLLTGIKVPILGISFFSLFIGTFAFLMFIKAIKIIFGMGEEK